MNISDIETFLMLVRTRNITKTAESLYVSQPTVSHRLKLLENELGVVLLSRRKGYKKVELTAKGEEFVPIAERWLALMNETMALQTTGEFHRLSIGCTNTLNASSLAELYRRISINPDYRLNMKITTHYSFQIYELVENHGLDVGFVFHNLHFKNIDSEPVLREKMFLVQEASGAVPGERVPVEKLDLGREVCLVWETNYQIWHDQNVTKGRPVHIEVDIYDLLEELIRVPGAWTIAPASVAYKLRERTGAVISRISSRQSPPDRTTYRIVHRDMSESKRQALSVFETVMREYFAEKGWEYLGSNH